jgi:SNF2 family DNA or RNA helicase
MLELLETINEKVIIFTQWQTSAKEIAEALSPHKVILITGDTADKHTPLQEFRTNPKVKYLVATDCLNYGLSIPEAHIMIHFDKPFSPAKIEQREGRIDRLTQQNKMLIISLVALNSIEVTVEKILSRKGKMFDTVVDGKPIAAEADITQEIIQDIKNVSQEE